MPSLAVLGPILIPLAAAGLVALLGFAGRNGQWIAAVGAWVSALALCAVWLPVRSSQELNLGPLGLGSSLIVRIDSVAFVFGLMVLIPAAVLLTFQSRAWREASLAMLGVTGAMAAVEAGDAVLTAIAGGATASLAVVLLDVEDARAPRPRWILLFAAWLALGWAGATLQVRGGTADYTAVPVSTLTVDVFALVALAALMASGLFPWRSWPAQVWSRPSLRAASVTVATIYPLGFYLLVRAYEMGGGHYPHAVLNAGLSTLGVLVALGAAVRAQAVETRREFLGEVIPAFGGFALMAIALGTPLGLAAALIMLATAAALVACLSLVPDRAGIASLVAIAAAAGLPPGLAFGSRVIGIEATFETADFIGLIGLAGTVAWAVWMVGAARAIGLPAGRGRPAAETFPRVALAIATLTLVAGPALALFNAALANPVQAAVMPSATTPAARDLASVVTVSTVLPAVGLFVPLLLIGAALYVWAGTAAIRSQARPVLFVMPGSSLFGRATAAIRSATVPEEYRSILSLRQLEAAAAGASPVLWLAAVVALAFAVSR
ncbi:MAG: hypothetical protein E6J53_07475 [Chloroflexi bacterium]|nr:MAG: hypothetical protein E6J53_07475 [Chloroflexota bacterium]